MSQKLEELKTAYEELSQEELEEITGGCKKNGHEVVASFTPCFTHSFELAPRPTIMGSLYDTWWNCSKKGQCGCCTHLEISAGMGYCLLS